MNDTASTNPYAEGYASGYEDARLEINAADLVPEDLANAEVWIAFDGSVHTDFKGTTRIQLETLLGGIDDVRDLICKYLESMDADDGE